jgi:hypothetical protein
VTLASSVLTTIWLKVSRSLDPKCDRVPWHNLEKSAQIEQSSRTDE